MTENEQKQLRAYCAFLLREYGFQFSTHDPVIPALYTIHKEVEVLRQSNHKLASLVTQAASKINPVTFHFNHKGEAWRFQMGITLRWIFFGLLLALFAWIGIWYWSMKNEIDHVLMMNQTFETTGQLNRRVKKEDGIYFIDFTVASGDSVKYFTEYRKINTKTIRVYLGKEHKQ